MRLFRLSDKFKGNHSLVHICVFPCAEVLLVHHCVYSLISLTEILVLIVPRKVLHVLTFEYN